MQLATLLGVSAVDLGQEETAAVLFGFAAAERERLHIPTRRSQGPLADQATETCRAALGSTRFDELSQRGRQTHWSASPRIDY